MRELPYTVTHIMTLIRQPDGSLRPLHRARCAVPECAHETPARSKAAETRDDVFDHALGHAVGRGA